MQQRLSASEIEQQLSALDADTQAAIIAQLVTPFIADESYRDHFALWEERGFHITPNHFYQPIPDSRTLSDDLWTREIPMPGVDMRDAEQLQFLRDVCPQFADEYNHFPDHQTEVAHEYYFKNNFFEVMDGSVAWCMLRHLQPQRILELGSGFSTLLMADAVRRNGNIRDYMVVDPYPNAVVRAGVPGVSRVLIQPAEPLDPALFAALEDGDLLFIDTSHVIKLGGEVNFLFLEMLPQLKSGVTVHIHDIFLPHQYPMMWVKERRQFWTEQYLLQAFLCFNSAFEVLFANAYMWARHPEEVAATFPRAPRHMGGASFWIRRV